MRTGLAETIRLLFIDQGIEFEDEAVTDWAAMKPTMRFGQVPCLKVDGVEMVQTNAILRYLARDLDLYDDEKMAQFSVDMWNDAVNDMKTKYVTMIYQNYEEGKAGYIDSFPGLIAPFEKQLADNKFLAGNKISFADYNFFNLLDCNEILSAGIFAKFPSVSAYFQRMADRPKIAAYRQTDLFKTRPLNGNGKQ